MKTLEMILIIYILLNWSLLELDKDIDKEKKNIKKENIPKKEKEGKRK